MALNSSWLAWQLCHFEVTGRERFAISLSFAALVTENQQLKHYCIFLFWNYFSLIFCMATLFLAEHQQ